MIKIFADGADFTKICELNKIDYIKGFTTNPTLMRSEGVKDYSSFCKDLLSIVKEKPISFEVFADDFHEMKKQALLISSWGGNVNVKIPITNIYILSKYDEIQIAKSVDINNMCKLII